jgi:DNA-binding transcriptional regulator YiaG
MYHFTDGGLRNIWLSNGYVEHKTPYGKGVSFHDLDGLVVAICSALCEKPGKLTGAEFRYIRLALLLSQKSLGKLLGYTEQAVAKWEKFGKVPKLADAALRLIFIERYQGRGKAAAVVEMFNAIDRVTSARIIITEAKSKWTSVVETDEKIAA